MAGQRVGLDPLADDYRALGTDAHPMEYVAAPVEEMPFGDATFDVVTSFNSLDHVDDLDRAIGEIKRVLRPSGHFILIVETGHEPTWSEPQTISWHVCARLNRKLQVVRSHRYERGGDNIYADAWVGRPYDHADPTPRPGLLVAVLQRH